MTDGEKVIVRLTRIGEACDAVFLSQPGEQGESTGEQLVRVALMAHVEKKTVMAEIKYVVQRDRKFHNPDIGSEMAPGLHDLITDCLPDVPSQFGELIDGQFSEINGTLDGGENLHIHVESFRYG